MMKSATMDWQQRTEGGTVRTGAAERLSSMLALGQWICTPLLSFGAALLAITLALSVFETHDVMRMLELAASVAGVFLPVLAMVRVRKWHRMGRYSLSVAVNVLLIACTGFMLLNIITEGRLF
jgi:hypothetical protein